MSWGHLGRGELHHAQQEHNCSWLLSLGGLIWEAPDVCRSSTPRDTPSGYLEGAGEASSDHSSSTDAVLGSITCLPHGLGHFISVSPSLPSLSLGREITLPLHTLYGQVHYPIPKAERAFGHVTSLAGTELFPEAGVCLNRLEEFISMSLLCWILLFTFLAGGIAKPPSN